ncbi:MAG: hypothetical protein ACREMN_01400 [Gemmatimonadales bacterium]
MTLLAMACRPAARPSYQITLLSLSPPRFAVRAAVTPTDDTLRMAQSRSCDVAAICEAGWPALIEDLRVAGAGGRPLTATAAGSAGWVVRGAAGSLMLLEYVVDYSALAGQGWPAPRETAYLADSMLYTVGRPFFVGRSADDTVLVEFALPAGMSVHAPWQPERSMGEFRVAGFEAATENGIVFARRPLPRASAGDLAVDVALYGPWQDRRDSVARLIGAHLATFTKLFESDAPGRYLATFLEADDFGGEAFLDSYAVSAHPDSGSARWGRIIGHELFHYWNGHRIRGADYIASQWFQEGITEYYAILSMVRNGFISPGGALERLSQHLRAQRRFEGSLTASGGRKNAAFYGTATLVALLLDITIRDRSGGRRSLDDLMHAMWDRFGKDRRPYTQADVVALAGEMAGTDLRPFFAAYVEGTAALPLDTTLGRAGLRVTRDAITIDPSAPADQRAIWNAVILASSP